MHDGPSYYWCFGVDLLATIEFMFLLEDKFKILMSGEPVAVVTVGDHAHEVDLQIAKQKNNTST
jgi:acyl carrier protein